MRIIEKDTQSRRIISQKTIDRVIRIFTFTFFLIVCFLTTGGQKIIVDSKKEKTVTVKGRVVAFQVLKPDFWKATIDPYSGYTEYSGDNEVVHYQSVIEIYKNKLNGVDSGGVTIEVKNIEKYGKPLTEVFQKQIQEYEVKFAKMEKEEIAVKNSKYESVSTLMHSTNPNSDFNQYTVLIDAGNKFNYDILISIVISYGRRRATEEEIEIFKKIVDSFKMLRVK